MSNDDNKISIFYKSLCIFSFVYLFVSLFSERHPLTEKFRQGIGYRLCDSITSDQSLEQRARHTIRAQKGMTSLKSQERHRRKVIIRSQQQDPHPHSIKEYFGSCKDFSINSSKAKASPVSCLGVAQVAQLKILIASGSSCLWARKASRLG